MLLANGVNVSFDAVAPASVLQNPEVAGALLLQPGSVSLHNNVTVASCFKWSGTAAGHYVSPVRQAIVGLALPTTKGWTVAMVLQPAAGLHA